MATKPAKAKPSTKGKPEEKKPTSVKERMDAYSEDRVMQELADGTSMRDIAQVAGVTFGSISVWLNENPERSARAREARALAARKWDEKAMEVIEDAGDQFELAKAKELAHHYRWRASKTAPKDYGDKVTAEHTGLDGGPIMVAPTVIELVTPSVKSAD